MSIRSIARAMDVSAGCISGKLHRLGLLKRGGMGSQSGTRQARRINKIRVDSKPIDRTNFRRRRAKNKPGRICYFLGLSGLI
jgi:hypothetical protein